jgi:aldehyde:ferredoxin oxidoreductase
MSAPVTSKYCGFAPKIIKVDLTREKIITVPLTLDLALNYIGGRGINSKILFDEVPAKIDPFHPENRVIFGVGPLNGTLSPSSGRFTVTAKSPLTNGFGDANCGGEFAAEMKFAGYSTIVLSGKAKKPVYLWVDDDKISLEKATGLWGLNTWETEEEIQQKQGDPEIQVACIGQGGENKIRYACVMHQLGRAAGRSGMGAVMGSKNLKAVAIRGSGGVSIAHPQALEDTVLEAQKKLQRDVFYRLYADYGTPGLMTLYNEYGGNASYNNKETQVDWIDEMSGERFVEKYKVKTQACFSCPLHCDIFYRVDTGKYACYGNSMEYENMTAFGTRCGNRNLESVLKASTLSDHYGLDVISCGATISWAFEAYE